MPCAAAMLLLGACSFSSPGGSGEPADAPAGDGPPPGDADAGACADDDGDTVCNTVDRCPGHDDRLDADQDGVPDGCDDWPCGAKPADPGDPMADSNPDGRSWTATPISIGNARRVVAAAGQQYSAAFGWGILVPCPDGQPNCKAQAEVGYGATRIGCIFDGNVSNNRLFVLPFSGKLTAPSTPGVYELRFDAGQRSSCGDSQQPWFSGDPGPDSTIAILCVTP
jgi:hypothetical protein